MAGLIVNMGYGGDLYAPGWRIVVRRDCSVVAIKHGLSPPNPEKFAPYEMAVNLIAGTVIVVVIGAVSLGLWEYGTWSAIAGSTICCVALSPQWRTASKLKKSVLTRTY